MDLLKPYREVQRKQPVVMKASVLEALMAHVRQRLVEYGPAAEFMPLQEQFKLANDLGKYTACSELLR